jgi:hypothetical protein
MGRDHLLDLGADGRILKCLEEPGTEGVDWVHLAQDTVQAGCCEHGNKPSGSIKGGNIDQLSYHQVLKKDLAGSVALI